MSEFITIFNAKNIKSKSPISPYDDNTFIFETYEVNSNLQLFSIMCTHFILNIPLHKQTKPVRTFRRIVNLEQYYNENITYLVLDIDEVKSEFDKQQILDYFKDYKVIIGESKSYNGINNFNLKGVLFAHEMPLTEAKHALSIIHNDLKHLCVIDESVTRRATLNAPLLKNNVFLNNEDGIKFKFVKSDVITQTDEAKKEYIKTSSDIALNVDDLHLQDIDTIEKLCLTIFQSMGYSAIKNNPNGSISFKHPSERKTPGGYFWFSTAPYTMHHGNSTKIVNIYDAVRKLDIAKDLLKKDINYDNEFLAFDTDTKVVSVNEKFLSVNETIVSKIEEFLGNKNGLLSIRSPMGTGKSTIINHIIDECHSIDMKVLIITNRVSVANDFGKKYNIKVYNKDKYELGDSLVCQYDSLWRYNIKFFDIVIMDEFISLMSHARSNLNNSSINIAKFFGCFNKKLVIADAFLTGYENFLLSNKQSNLHMIDNVYRDPSTLYDYEDFNYFVQSILVHSEKAKLTVSSTSLSFIRALQLILSNRNLKVVTLTAETPASTKELIYNLFEKEEHDKWDVLIFSPTLTVGVSNVNNVPYHFHYDSSISTDVISSIQMIKRTRKAKEVHMFIRDKINYIKTSYNDIRDEYMCNIGKNIEQNYLFDIDDYGEVRLSNIGKKAIKIDTFKNILEFNHKAAMMWLLKYHFLYEPRVVEHTFSSNVLLKYQREIKENTNSLLLNNIDQFLSLNDFEKTSILLDVGADKTLKALAEIDNEILDCSKEVKEEILKETLKDTDFIKKCKNYKILYNFTNEIYTDVDIKSFISKCITNPSTNGDLHFYNILLQIGVISLEDSYAIKYLNKNRSLRYVLEKCGYKNETSNDIRISGNRAFSVNEKVKMYFGYIK